MITRAVSQDNKAAAIDTLRRMTAYEDQERRGRGRAPATISLLTEVVAEAEVHKSGRREFRGDQAHQHDGIKAMFPYTDGNCPEDKCWIRLPTISLQRSRHQAARIHGTSRSRTNRWAIHTTTSRRGIRRRRRQHLSPFVAFATTPVLDDRACASTADDRGSSTRDRKKRRKGTLEKGLAGGQQCNRP
jgi:hypothetical protein